MGEEKGQLLLYDICKVHTYLSGCMNWLGTLSSCQNRQVYYALFKILCSFQELTIWRLRKEEAESEIGHLDRMGFFAFFYSFDHHVGVLIGQQILHLPQPKKTPTAGRGTNLYRSFVYCCERISKYFMFVLDCGQCDVKSIYSYIPVNSSIICKSGLIGNKFSPIPNAGMLHNRSGLRGVQYAGVDGKKNWF